MDYLDGADPEWIEGNAEAARKYDWLLTGWW